MKRRIVPVLFLTVASISMFFYSCSKINMATELGQGLIPPVDNVNTFDTTLEVSTFNGLFTAATDTFRSLYYDEKIVGMASDPVFGKTDARVYFQVAPTSSGRSPFLNEPGKLYLDSVVLVIKNDLIYGDTLTPMTIQVAEVDPLNDFNNDTSYYLSQTFTASNILGNKTFVPRSLKDSIQVIDRPDTNTVVNQLRIPLDNSFGQRLLAYDTTGVNEAYSSDSMFHTKFKGFALHATGGNTLLALDLTDASTALAVYYRYQNKDTATKMDTAVAYLSFAKSNSSGGIANASANYINRDYNGTNVLTGTDDDVEDDVVYIQKNPGLYSTIKIPALKNFGNYVIHSAELQMESIYDISDTLFNAPSDVFLDVYDSTEKNYHTVPYAFTLQSDGSIADYPLFYSVLSNSSNKQYYYKSDPSGRPVKQWRFNLTRYVQNIVNQKLPLYDFRLYAPARVVLKTNLPADVNTTTNVVYPRTASTLAVPGIGRVRIGGGNHPEQRMKLRIVYSKPQLQQ